MKFREGNVFAGICLSTGGDNGEETSPPPPRGQEANTHSPIWPTGGQYASYWNAYLLKKNLKDISPFCEVTDTPVLDLWCCLLWGSKPEWAALFMLDRGICVVCSLTFTSGATTSW